MATRKQVWDAIKGILEGDATLKGYVKNIAAIYEGLRDNVPTTIYPYLALEPADYDRGPHEAGFDAAIWTPVIYGVIMSEDKDLQIWSDSPKGCLNFETDVESALYATYPTLGRDDVEYFRIKSEPAYGEYPARGFAMSVEVHYQIER